MTLAEMLSVLRTRAQIALRILYGVAISLYILSPEAWHDAWSRRHPDKYERGAPLAKAVRVVHWLPAPEFR
jgi:hypothetical protein